jgi:hypothetical protein
MRNVSEASVSIGASYNDNDDDDKGAVESK